MPLKFIKSPIKDKNSLRKTLHGHLAGLEPGRPLKTLHASDLTYSEHEFCPRERALLLRDKAKPPPQRITTSEQVTFRIGWDLEAAVREWFIELGMLVGDWACQHCGRKYLFQKHPYKCKLCSGKHFEYKEVRVQTTSGIGCGLDMLLDMPGSAKHVVLEHKSIDKEKYKALVAPLADHVRRSKLYLKAVEEDESDRSNLIRSDRMLILYTSKGGYGTSCPEVKLWDFWDGAFSPFKDFEILRDDEAIEDLDAKAWELEDWKKTGDLPCRICQSSLDKRAKKCNKATACWKEDE